MIKLTKKQKQEIIGNILIEVVSNENVLLYPDRTIVISKIESEKEYLRIINYVKQNLIKGIKSYIINVLQVEDYLKYDFNIMFIDKYEKNTLYITF